MHRLLRTYVSVIDAFTIFIYSICAQTKISKIQYAKMQGGWRRRGKHGALREDHLYCLGGEGVREGVCIISRDAQVPYYL